jgi:hypothetical protein
MCWRSIQRSRFAHWILAVITLNATSAGLPEARGQCSFDWLPGEGVPGVTGDLPVWAVTNWDPDGAGPAQEVLIAGGGFSGAGDITTFGIALWDGSDWHAMGDDGANNQVFALTVYNGDVIAAGAFTSIGGVAANRIARWDGAAWHPLGTGLNIHTARALAVYNGELYVGGMFNQAGGVPAEGIARWNGSTWQGVGGGVHLPPQNGITAVFALTVFDNKLIVGGGFTTAGGVPVKHVASWDGAAWQAMAVDNPAESMSVCEALAVYQGELYAGANIIAGGGFLRSMSRWDGTTWVGLGSTPNDAIWVMNVWNGNLIIGGMFTNVGGIPALRIAGWNGSNFFSLGLGTRSTRALGVYSDELIVGGTGTEPSGLQNSLIFGWDGTHFNGLGDGFDFIVYDFAAYKNELIAGGWFSQAVDVPAGGIARRDSAGQWHAMGHVSGGDGYVSDLVVYDDKLIASGSFTSAGGVPTPNAVAAWNGSTWQAFGNAPVSRKLVQDGVLYATGSFGLNRHVAEWVPETQSWQPIGVFPPNVAISAITFFEGDLIAGGTGGGGNNASVWRWDFKDPSWQPVGQHLNFTIVHTLAVYNGELLAGGTIDGGIMRFNGTSWEVFHGGAFLTNDLLIDSLIVFDMHVFNGDLFIAGSFGHVGEQQYSPGSVTARMVAGWDGTQWFNLGGSFMGASDAVVTLHDHLGTLVMGGWFDWAGSAPNGWWAQWGPSCSPGDVNCDLVVDLADVSLFVNALLDPATADACLTSAADLNQDGQLNGADIGNFVPCVLTGGCP